MNKQILIVLALSLAGCATARSNYNTIPLGATKEEAIAIMGNPELATQDGQGRNVMFWGVDGGMSGCGVILDSENKVRGKECISGGGGPAQRSTASSYQPAAPYQMPIYQAPRPSQTNCQTTMIGGVAHTSCNSQATGIDTSIYR